MIFCKNITKSFGAQTLLKNADFQLNKKERVGIVGRNGYGKSTLFQVLLKKDTIDDGDIAVPENYRIGGLDQHLNFSQKNIVEEVVQGLEEEEQYDHWKAEKILSGLGFSETDFKKAPETFSGGFQIRIKLAQLLVSEPDLLLLDEPTNHLDILSIRWLENFLKNWHGEILCVSHDQNFLEKVMTHTTIIHRQKLKKIKGSPQKLYRQIEEEEGLYEKTRVLAEKEKNRQEKFIREFRSGARSAGLVQSRIKMLEKKEKLSQLSAIPPINFKFLEKEFLGTKMLEAHNLSFGYEPLQDLLKKLSFEILPNEKIGIIGANGKGKSTLLKLLTQEIQQKSGTIKPNINLEFGYFGQSNVERLDGKKNILEELSSIGNIGKQQVRSIAGSLLFSGDLAYKKIEILSGGEKARVNLGKILLTPLNCLYLDEPTNHLDYESVEALIIAVKKFTGGVLFVSHDENFLRNVAEKLIVFDENKVFVFQGNYEKFLQERGFSNENAETPTTLIKTKQNKQNPVHKEETKEKNRLIRPLKRKLERLEKQIIEIEKTQIENKNDFDKAHKQGNRLKMETLGIQYQDLQKKLETILEDWTTVGEEMEEIEISFQN